MKPKALCFLLLTAMLLCSSCLVRAERPERNIVRQLGRDYDWGYMLCRLDR